MRSLLRGWRLRHTETQVLMYEHWHGWRFGDRPVWTTVRGALVLPNNRDGHTHGAPPR